MFAPKFRRKEIYGKLKQEIGMILRELCRRKEVEIKTKDGHTTRGEIGDISEHSVDILPKHQPAQTIKFADIESISY